MSIYDPITKLPGFPPQQSVLDKALGILNTPGGAALVNAAGAGISAYGANKSAEADRAMTAQQFAANMAQRQLEGDRDFQQNAAIGAANASPLGAEQMYAQRMALLLPILQNARNVVAKPGDPGVAAAMGGGLQGGLRLPSGGLDPAMLQQKFGEQATLDAIMNRQKQVGAINPRGSAMNLGNLFGEAGTAASADVASANQAELNRQLDESARNRQLIQRAIDEDIRGQYQQGSSKGSKAKSALGGAASGAMKGASLGSIVPGIGTGIGAAIGGIGGFLKGLF